MNLSTLIWKEMRGRATPMLTSLLAVSLGVMALVAIQNITGASEEQIAGQLETLGANVLVLPRKASLQDYYAADLHGETLPEEYVSKLALARLPGVEHLAPKLCVETKVYDREVTVTGILPQQEFQSKAAWQGLGMLSESIGSDRGCCTKVADATDESPEALATQRSIHKLGKYEVVLGQDVAKRLALRKGDAIALFGEKFQVLAVLPETGTVDDSRLFAHLHTIQDLAGSGPVVNVIEIMACCEDAAGSLISNLSAELPDSRIVTISQMVQTQVAVNGLMSRMSWGFFAILLLVAASSIASVMYANVTERRKEIGTLMAVGAGRWFVVSLFLGKAAVLGVAGGLIGFVAGTTAAVWLGPQWLNVAVEPKPDLLLVGMGAATIVAVAASYLPARRAASLDPCLVFHDA